MILCIDTAISQTAAGLLKDGVLVASTEGQPAIKASEVLHLLIEELFRKNDVRMGDLQAVAVNGGPGSYTGLRIGASAAKGFCYALDIPLLHVDGLELLAATAVRQIAGDQQRYVIPMIDARRDEVFTAVFDHELNMVLPAGPMILDEESFGDYIGSRAIFFGNGALKAEKLLPQRENFSFHDGMSGMADMAVLAWRSWKQGDFHNSITYVPNYLKKFHFTAQKTQ